MRLLYKAFRYLIPVRSKCKIILRYFSANKFLRCFSFGVLFTLSSVLVTNLDLSLGVEISDVASIETQEISSFTLVEAGKKYYQVGKFAQAIAKWQQALQIFSSTGDILNQSAVLSNLALAYQKLGRIDQASGAIEDSLKLLNNLKTSQAKSLQADALNIQGSLLLSQGKTQKALTVWVNASEN